MKIAFAGKGGAGKTTIAALFIKALAEDGNRILAVDCDPVANLGRQLGIKDADKITPILQMKDMINERMGTSSSDRSFYKLNPRVDDIPEKFSKKKDNIRLIVIGTVEAGGSGCMCPESGFLKALLSKLMLDKDETVVMDMEAGLEHLGRGTAGFVDHLFIIMEPSLSSIEAAKKIARLSEDLKIKNISVILNKAKRKEDADFVKKNTTPLSLIGVIPFNDNILESETGRKVIDIKKTDVYSAVLEIKTKILEKAEVR